MNIGYKKKALNPFTFGIAEVSQGRLKMWTIGWVQDLGRSSISIKYAYYAYIFNLKLV